MEKLTFTMGNYLEAVYELSSEGTGARVSDMADRLKVTRPATNSAISTLSEKGLVTNEKYGDIFLTPKERTSRADLKQASHDPAVFTEILKLDYATADTDAQRAVSLIRRTSFSSRQLIL